MAWDAVTGEKMGYLDYQSGDGEIKIGMVEVEPKVPPQRGGSGAVPAIQATGFSGASLRQSYPGRPGVVTDSGPR